MRILFFLEPVIFRNDPSHFSAHFHWVKCFEEAARASGGAFALISNDNTCAAWYETEHAGSKHVCFPLNPFSILADFHFNLAEYARSVYSPNVPETYLVRKLLEISEEFEPDLIVTSSQSSFVRKAFDGLPILHVEQAPLPRLGHPQRLMIDPLGHQTDSMLERFADAIRSLSLSKSQKADCDTLLSAIERKLSIHPKAKEARTALQNLAADAKVALFVTQPVDGVTYEGAYKDIRLESLLFEWAQALPPGWVGVPTYHFGQRLSAEMEAALAQATPQLRFLPQDLSQDMTEFLLLCADGMITISSTSAMTGLLFRKAVVVTGKSPVKSWCVDDPSQIDQAKALTRPEALSTLAFLTNGYARPFADIESNPKRLTDIIKDLIANREASLLDLSGWSIKQALPLFKFDFCLTDGGLSGGACERPKLERALEDVRAELDSYKAEWGAAVADRDKQLGELMALQKIYDDTIAVHSIQLAEFEARNQEVIQLRTELTLALSRQVAISEEIRSLKQTLDSEINIRQTVQSEKSDLMAQLKAEVSDAEIMAKRHASEIEAQTAVIMEQKKQLIDQVSLNSNLTNELDLLKSRSLVDRMLNK